MKFDFKAAIPIKRKKLDSGLELVLVNIPTVPIVSLSLAYKVGSKDEKPGKTGFAHLFEHLMFEGSRNVPKGEFDKLCSMAGGTNNAYTTYDYTNYVMTVPSHQLELALWLESDRMFRSDINETALANQKKVVTEEILQTVENQPYARWREVLAKNAYSKESSYSWEVHGRKEDVASSGIDDVREFYRTYYKPGNATLTLAGNFNDEKAIELVQKYFGHKVESPSIKRNNFSEEFKMRGTYGLLKDNVPMPAVFVAYHLGGFREKEIDTADVLSYIAGTGRSSRLHDSLVYDRQVASQAGAFVDKREHCSLLTFYAVASSPDTSADELYSSLTGELDNMNRENISANILEKAQNQLTVQLCDMLLQTSGIADVSSNLTLFWNNPERLYEMTDIYNKVTEKDIMKLFRERITTENSVRVDVIPE
jgi:zinc protease